VALDVRLSALSPQERLDAMRDYMRGWRLPMDLRPHQPLNVTARSSESDLGAVGLLSTYGSGATVVRDARLARDNTPPYLLLSLLGSGTSVLTQGNRTAHLRVGDLVAYTSTKPFLNSFLAGTIRHSLLIPTDTLGLPARLLRDMIARPLGPGLPLAGVASSYLRRLAAAAPAMSATERAAAEEPTVALARALLTTCGGDTRRSADALGATLDVRVLEYLRLHLRDRDLSAARIAAAHNISERHLYTVLARNGISLRTWLRDERLRGAAQALTEPAGQTMTITALAHRWGFADHSHFTREFRKHYGITPTEWRSTPHTSHTTPHAQTSFGQ
jgi:AraC-like DNA-binding protein